MENTRRVFFAPLQASHELKLLFAGSMVGGSSRGSRPYCLLHYVTRGEGTVLVEGGSSTLCAGDLFVNAPGSSVDYRPSPADPWTCYWMAFEGAGVEGCLASLVPDQSTPVCRGDYDSETEERFEALLQSMASKSAAHILQSEAIMRLLLSRFLAQFGVKPDAGKPGTPLTAVRQAQGFMLMHHAEPLTITDVCRAAGYERTYFSNLFRQQTGQTMLAYLTSIRITKACKLLTTTTLTVQAIAQRLGYDDYRSFSRCFKRHKKLSPQQYREG